jgi:WD40 repeat protein
MESPSTERYESFDALKAAHTGLLSAQSDDLTGQAAEEATTFVKRAVLTGAILDSPAERKQAQGLIDYWVASLISSSRTASGSAMGSTDRLRPAVTLLADFEPDTLDRAVETADRWFRALPEADQVVARHLMLRLVRLGPDGQTFEPEPTTRAALRNLAPWPAKVDEILAGLAAAGVARLTKKSSADVDAVELRARELLSRWPAFARWLDDRRAFRKRVERWAANQKPDDRLLHGQALEEVLVYHDRDNLEQEFTDTSRRYKGRLEAARRTLERLELRDRAERYKAGDKSALLDRDAVSVADNWLDTPEVRAFLLTAEIKDLIDRSRTHWDNEEKRLLRRQNRIRAILCGLLLVALIIVIGLAFLYRAAEKKAEAALELNRELGEARQLHQKVLRTIQVVDTNPHTYVQLALDVLDQVSPSKGVRSRDAFDRWRGRLPVLDQVSASRELKDLHEDMRNDTLVLLNKALQIDFTELILGSTEKYDVDAVTLSGDSSLVAAACNDADAGRVRVWEVALGGTTSPREVENIPAIEGAKEIRDVAFGGPRGRWLAAACGKQGFFVLFDPGNPSGKWRQLPEAEPKGSRNGVAWMPRPGGGGWILVGTADLDSDYQLGKQGGLLSWQVTDEQPEFLPLDIEGQPFPAMSAVACSPEGEGMFAAKQNEGTIWYWKFEMEAWRTIRRETITGYKHPQVWNRLAVGYAGDGDKKRGFLLAAGEDGQAVLWDFHKEQADPLLVLRHPCPVRGVSFLADRYGVHWIATAGRDTKVRLWITDQAELARPQHANVWDVGTANVLTLAGHTEKLTDVKFAPVHDKVPFLVSSADDGIVRCWSLKPRVGPVTRKGLFDFAYFAFSPDLNAVAACDREPNTPASDELFFRKLQPGGIGLKELRLPEKAIIRRVAFHPDGSRWATLDDAGTFRLWGGAEGKPVAIPPPTDELTGEPSGGLLPQVYGKFAFSRTGRFVAYSLTKNIILVYQLDPQLKPVLAITKSKLVKWSEARDPAVYGFALDEMNNRLALGCSGGLVILLDLSAPSDEGRPLGRLRIEGEEKPAINSVSFSPSGRWLAAGCTDASVRILEVQLDRSAAPLRWTDQQPEKRHTKEVTRVSFNPRREDELASGGDDGLLYVWRKQENETWRAPYRFDTGEGSIQTLSYDQQGTRVGTANSAGQVSVYWLDLEQLVKIATDRLKNSGVPLGEGP